MAATGASRTKAAARAKLEKVLATKLIQKYGDNFEGSAVNARIRVIVAQFMADRVHVGEPDLVALEREVRKLARTQTHALGIGRPRTASARRGGAGDMVADARNTKEDAKRNRLGGVPAALKNDWLILETYQVMQTEKKQAEEAQHSIDMIAQCKKDLGRQLEEQKKFREKEKLLEQQHLDNQKKLQAEHIQDQVAAKQAMRERLLEEKRIREFQIQQNEERRQAEREAQKLEDKRTLKACKRFLKMEKDMREKKAREHAEALRIMRWQSEEDRRICMERRVREEQEELRLREEYKERLDRYAKW